jgi:cytochrome P450
MLATDLEHQDILMWCCILLAAGVETTGNLIGAGMDLLLRHPDQMRRLAEDPSLTRQALSEMLRVVTPGRYIRRTATADTTLGGHEIATGDVLALNFTVANYDPVMFEDPLRFDIDRNPNEALAFSYGPHRCIGMSVARMESTIAFEELLTRFPHTQGAGPAVMRPSTATAVVESLPVVFRA